MPEEQDPVISAWFSLEFQNEIAGAFRECTGLGSENEVVEHKASGPNGTYVMQKIPGRMKWNNITLKRGITDAMDLWDWRKKVELGDMKNARRSGSIVMYNQAGGEVARWNFVNAWPNKLTGPTANATNNEVAIEELEITHEGYERVKGPKGTARV
jgi:phage tail-like protein